MRIGIDFDNTIADYSGVFAQAAVDLGMLERGYDGDKPAVRDTLRNGPGGERAWQQLQGQVYGRYMPLARPMPGVREFLDACRTHDAKVLVISHKTEFGHFDPARINLRDAAISWMNENGFFNPAQSPLRRDDVTFEATRADKVTRIAAADITHYIDDLPEVFAEAHFPQATKQYLLHVPPYEHWNKIREAIFGA